MQLFICKCMESPNFLQRPPSLALGLRVPQLSHFVASPAVLGDRQAPFGFPNTEESERRPGREGCLVTQTVYCKARASLRVWRNQTQGSGHSHRPVSELPSWCRGTLNPASRALRLPGGGPGNPCFYEPFWCRNEPPDAGCM